MGSDYYKHSLTLAPLQSVAGYRAPASFTRQSARTKKPAAATPRLENRYSMRPPASKPKEAGQLKSQSAQIKGVDPKYVEMVEKDIVDKSPAVQWMDIGKR